MGFREHEEGEGFGFREHEEGGGGVGNMRRGRAQPAEHGNDIKLG